MLGVALGTVVALAAANAMKSMLFGVGSADPISGAHMIARLRELQISASIVELPRVGHYPQVEAPQAVLAAVQHALATMPA